MMWSTSCRVVAGEHIGKQFDEEIHKARRDQGRGRGGSDSGWRQELITGCHSPAVAQMNI